MGAVFGNVQHSPVFRGQLRAAPFAEGRRGRPEVNRHVKDCALRAAHQFRLKRGRYLKMQSADRSLAGAELHVGLNRRKADAMVFEFPHAPRAHETATFIVMRARIDDPGAPHSGLCKKHRRYDPPN